MYNTNSQCDVRSVAAQERWKRREGLELPNGSSAAHMVKEAAAEEVFIFILAVIPGFRGSMLCEGTVVM